MGKRRKGKGKGKKKQPAMTRRGDTAKRSSSSPPNDVDSDEDDGEDDGDDSASGAKATSDDDAADASDASSDKDDLKAASGGGDDEADGDSDADEEAEADEDDDDADDADDADKDDADDADKDNVDKDDDAVEAADAAGDDEGRDKGDAVKGGDDADDDDVPESTVGLPTGASWAQPLVKLEHRWTWIEVRLMFTALFGLMLVLVFWAAMGSMADSLESRVVKGDLFRMIVGASVCAIVVRLATRKRLDETKRVWITTAAVVIGVLTARYWRGFGIEFFANMADWLDKGSTFALFGGLKGMSTRLTMFVSLLGGSLAAASGTHIAIDAVVRLVPKKFRVTVAVTSASTTALVCFLAAWGFFDHVAVTALGAKMDDPTGKKVSVATERVSEHWFMFRKQLKLDMRTIPRVLNTEKWNEAEAFTGRDLNQFMDDNGYVEQYGEEEAKRLRAPESALDRGYLPVVRRPGGEVEGQLKHSVDLMWPWGFLMIGLRFLLRAILIFAGHVKLEEDIVDEDEDAGAGDKAAVEGA